MRRYLAVVLAVVTLGAAVVLVDDVALAGELKTSICHVTGAGNDAVPQWQRLDVAEPAVESHLAHGDGLPGGPVPEMDGYVFDEDCTPLVSVGAVTGRVVDVFYQAALPWAEVTLDGPVFVRTSTDISGYFEFPEVDEGLYDLSVSLDGYHPANTTVVVTGGFTTEVYFELTALPGAVTGLVVDLFSGDAIGGAQVTLNGVGSGSTYTTYTAADGSFTLPQVYPPDGYELLVEATGYLPANTTVWVDGGLTTEVDFTLLPL